MVSNHWDVRRTAICQFQIEPKNHMYSPPHSKEILLHWTTDIWVLFVMFISKHMYICTYVSLSRLSRLICTSIQFSRSVVSYSLRRHELQHARLPVHHQLPEFTQTHVHRVSDATQPSHPLSSPSPPAPQIPPSMKVFSNESTLCMRWPKYWSFSFRIIPSKEIPGLISFRMDYLNLLAVQGTLKSLLQRHSSKASILQHSPFFNHKFLLYSWIIRCKNS